MFCMSRSTATKENLLEAAIRVVREDGAAQLTLDRVAKDAGVSKGGLLYHFPNKDALITALLTSYIEDTDKQLQAQLKSDTTPGAWARANLTLLANETSHSEGGTATALLAAALTNPKLLSEAREAYRLWQQQAETDDLEPGLGTLLRLALDGWWFACLLDLAPPQGDEQEAFKTAYVRLTQGGSQ